MKAIFLQIQGSTEIRVGGDRSKRVVRVTSTKTLLWRLQNVITIMCFDFVKIVAKHFRLRDNTNTPKFYIFTSLYLTIKTCNVFFFT